jgi:carboxyl-terminal processing protease
VLNYIESKGDKIEAKYGNDLQKFKNKFEFTAKEIDDFIQFANSKDIKFIKDDFEKDKDYIQTRLKAQVARNYWKNVGWYSVLLNIDTQFLKAVTLFGEAKELANLK